ncbi:MAG: hypothetical protein HY815_00420 [Candidatus Riflebacteria bacterium]|nr:hypothetical protein [Candidatus Riflebacteria bacterium]
MVDGCGLGWLYMRMADSQRIKAMKLLLFDSGKDRFKNARKLYENAINNYRESIMYDDTGNPMVYHKLGYTLLMLQPPDINGAENEFRVGIKLKKGKIAQAIEQEKKKEEKKDDGVSSGGLKKDKQDLSETEKKSAPTDTKSRDPSAEARTEEEIALDNDLGPAETYARKDEDYALMLSGVGLCKFLRGIRDKRDEEFKVAVKYHRLAEKYTTHPSTVNKKAAGVMQKILAYFDLDEIIDPTPHSVLQARVYLYQARQLFDQGQEALGDAAMGNAADALELIRVFYAKDSRFLTAQAEWHFVKKEYTKCLAALGEITAAQSYADQKVTSVLKSRALLATGDGEKAFAAVSDILDREPDDSQALLLRAAARAANKKDTKFQDIQLDVDTVFSSEANQQNLKLLLEAGDIFMSMGESERKRAKDYYIKAYYIDTKNIKANYLLGKAYQALGDQDNLKICFSRVCSIDPTSSYCKDVKALIQ